MVDIASKRFELTFEKKLAKSLEPFPRKSTKSAKNLYFDHFSWILRRTGFFFENPALSLCFKYRFLTSCQKSGKFITAFPRSFPSRNLTNNSTYGAQLTLRINYGDDLIGPLPFGGPKWCSPKDLMNWCAARVGVISNSISMRKNL